MKVCVTGASGFIATHLVFKLLQRGYQVVGTVRNLNNTRKTAFLRFLQQKYPNKLELVEADLLIPNSFDDAFIGCEAVFHTASPFWIHAQLSEEEAYKQFITPAVEGVKNALASAVKNKSTVKKMVVTSSVAAISDLLRPPASGVINEELWNTTSVFSDPQGAYRISKTKAEQTAWEFYKQEHGKDIEISVINPTFVFGQILPYENFAEDVPEELKPTESGAAAAASSPLDIGASVELVAKYVSGKIEKCPSSLIGMVDVKDVAEAHILALENPAANGNRFLVSLPSASYLDFCKTLKKLFPQFPIPLEYQNGEPKSIFQYDNSKSQQVLGVKYTDKEKTLRETVQSLIDFGFVKQ